MTQLDYQIGESKISVDVQGTFSKGDSIILSSAESDITFDQDWYQDGYTVEPLFSQDEFKKVLDSMTGIIRRMAEKETGLLHPDFSLEKYHNYVNNDETHYSIVGRTRDLFPEDFNVDIDEIHRRLSEKVGMKLTDVDPLTKIKMHIIVRINRPGSNDFNPPHKDIYEGYDGAVEGYDRGIIPRFMNFWIPIAGVTEHSSLPIAPGSHLLPENLISRTTEGGIVRGNQYRVRMIADWNGHSSMERAKVADTEVLMFSGHLIHGLAANEERDTTRVALEFRLFA